MLLSEQCQCVECSCVFLQNGWTGLHVATINGHCNVASALLNWGAEVDAVWKVSQYVVTSIGVMCELYGLSEHGDLHYGFL